MHVTHLDDQMTRLAADLTNGIIQQTPSTPLISSNATASHPMRMNLRRLCFVPMPHHASRK